MQERPGSTCERRAGCTRRPPRTTKHALEVNIRTSRDAPVQVHKRDVRPVRRTRLAQVREHPALQRVHPRVRLIHLQGHRISVY